MKKTIFIVVGTFLFIFLVLAIPKTDKTGSNIVKTSSENNSTQPSPTQVINTVTVEPTVTTPLYMTKEEYGKGVISVSEKTLEAQSLISLVTTLKTQNRYDEALENVNIEHNFNITKNHATVCGFIYVG